jgi:basic membrane protein A
MGGLPVPAVRRFGIGFVAGAYLAAKEMDVTINFPANRFDYLNTFGPSDEVKNKAATWFSAGTGVIHVAAGGAGTSVMAAAQEATGTKWVVGVDIDQAGQSDTVITSALKALGVVVKQALQEYLDDEFVGGQTFVLGAKEGAVALPFETSLFETFTLAQYNAVLAKVVNGTVVVPSSVDELVAFMETVDYPVPAGLGAAIANTPAS